MGFASVTTVLVLTPGILNGPVGLIPLMVVCPVVVPIFHNIFVMLVPLVGIVGIIGIPVVVGGIFVEFDVGLGIEVRAGWELGEEVVPGPRFFALVNELGWEHGWQELGDGIALDALGLRLGRVLREGGDPARVDLGRRVHSRGRGRLRPAELHVLVRGSR